MSVCVGSQKNAHLHCGISRGRYAALLNGIPPTRFAAIYRPIRRTRVRRERGIFISRGSSLAENLVIVSEHFQGYVTPRMIRKSAAPPRHSPFPSAISRLPVNMPAGTRVRGIYAIAYDRQGRPLAERAPTINTDASVVLVPLNFHAKYCVTVPQPSSTWRRQKVSPTLFPP